MIHRPQDTDGKSVMDRQYNDGLIERTLDNGELVYFGDRLTGDELIYEWEKHSGQNWIKLQIEEGL